MSGCTRRGALEAFAGFLAGSPLLAAQTNQGEPAGRIAPLRELVNVFEVQAMAQRKLGEAAFAHLTGSDRKAFDRMTFRQRLMVDTLKLDLSTELFGQRLFTPILVGPVAQQARFHADGELATAKGAAAGKALLVVSARSSQPLEKIAQTANQPFWLQVDPEGDTEAARVRVQQAAGIGCKAVCLTLGVSKGQWDWTAIDRFRKGLSVPVLLKGIMTAEEAQAAAGRGVQGIVISNYRGDGDSVLGLASPIEVLPAIASVLGGKLPILIDGGFRRGTDILKALALGAKAVLLGRPPMWGLAAYGADGVQYVVELLQSELARAMAMCGSVDIAHIERDMVKIHRR